ncbi:MAG: hypothetical protein ACT4PU_06715 [Planctomycetota bacterium]
MGPQDQPPPAAVALDFPAFSALSSSLPALDQALGGGWPAGELSELVGCGRSSLALAAVRQAQATGQPAAWVDGSGSFCPATAGVDLAALTLVRPPAPALSAAPRAVRRGRIPAGDALLAADLLLRSRAFALLVLDLPEAGAQGRRASSGRAPPLATWFRLARQAAEARSVLLLLGPAERAVAGSAAGLTLRARWRHAPSAAWELLPPPTLELEVLRRRGVAGGLVVRLAAGHAP